MLFEVAPHIFYWVEFRSVGGETRGKDSSLQSVEVLADQPTAVNGRAIPNDQQFAGELPPKMLQEFDHLRALDCARIEPKIEIPNGDAADDRKLLPIEIKFQNGCLSAGSPGANAVRLLTEPAFVDKDDDSVLFQGFFLSLGQSERFHFRMAASSRWMARVVGRWQLQPICPSKRQTWSG